jgi:hypothetical protein
MLCKVFYLYSRDFSQQSRSSLENTILHPKFLALLVDEALCTAIHSITQMGHNFVGTMSSPVILSKFLSFGICSERILLLLDVYPLEDLHNVSSILAILDA